MIKRWITWRTAIPWLILVGIALAGLWMLKAATPYGMGLRNDSVQYIFGARNLLAGNGYARTSGGGELKPITTVPPLFSAAIAAVSLSGLEALRAGRLLSLVLFAVNILLVGYLVHRLTRGWLFALAAAALFAFSAVFLDNFAWLMSEPLYLMLWLTGFIVLDRYLERPHPAWLFLLGLLSGMAYLTRYVGASLAATFCLTVLLFELGWRRKFRSVLIVATPPVICMAAWSIRNQLVIGDLVNRELGVHLVSAAKINFGIDNFWAWLLPDGPGHWVAVHAETFRVLFLVILFLAMGLWFAAAWRVIHQPGQAGDGVHEKRLLLAIGLAGLVYALLVLFSISFVDASSILDQRLLMPFTLPVLILLMVALQAFFRRPGWIHKMVVGLLLLTWLGASLADERVALDLLNDNGLGFNSLVIRDSPTIAYLQNLPGKLIYSNRAYMLSIISGRNAYMLVGPDDPVSQKTREGYGEYLAEFQEEVRSGRAVLVYFKEPGYEKSSWYLQISNGLPRLKEFGDGIIFGHGN